MDNDSPNPNSARQFASVQVPGDPGARGLMDANDFVDTPPPAAENTQGTYNAEMSRGYAHLKGPGLKVRPFSAKTNKSTQWTPQ